MIFAGLVFDCREGKCNLGAPTLLGHGSGGLPDAVPVGIGHGPVVGDHAVVLDSARIGTEVIGVSVIVQGVDREGHRVRAGPGRYAVSSTRTQRYFLGLRVLAEKSEIHVVAVIQHLEHGPDGCRFALEGLELN